MQQADPGSTTALILCGGLGTRLRPLTGDVPKSLASVDRQPFLYYLLAWLRSEHLSEIVLATGFGAGQLVDYCGDGSQWNLTIRYSQETEPLGTGGAIKHAEALIDSDPFLAMNGDSMVKADLAEVARFHAERHACITIVLVQVADKERFGSVVLAEDGAIERFSEKGEQGTGLISAGIYLIDRSVLQTIPADRPVSIEHEVFPRYVGNGLYGIVTSESFIDIGTPESYALAQSMFAPRGITKGRIGEGERGRE